MKKQLLNLSALITAITLSAFGNLSSEINPGENVKPEFTWYFFQFTGIRNSEEGDRAKWSEIPYVLYLLQPCGAPHYGCKLIANQAEYVDGILRPKEIYLTPNTKDPTTGSYVVSVSNHRN